MRAIGGIYVYQDNSGQGAAELKNRPFGAVSRPHTHSVSAMQSKGSQARCDALRLVCVLGPGEPDVLVAADERDAFGKSICRFEEGLPYRLSDDGAFWTSGITLHPSSLNAGRRRGSANRHPAIVCSNVKGFVLS
jgi:hypothetical protein